MKSLPLVQHVPAFDPCIWANIGLQHIFLGQDLRALAQELLQQCIPERGPPILALREHRFKPFSSGRL